MSNVVQRKDAGIEYIAYCSFPAYISNTESLIT